MGTVILDEVWKVFRDGTQAVRSISLEVDDGELFVFLGPSGSGKTTLLRTVAGLEGLTSGRILLNGEDVSDKTAADRDVAMVFQSYSLYPHMTVYDNIAFGIRSRKLKKRELDEQVRSVAATLNLEPLLKKKPRRLSGGEQQRVAIARAVARNPAAFLMDEPLSNLDVRSRASIRGEIARIQKEFGVTTLYVTHDQTEALALGDRIGILRDGMLEQVAAPAELYRLPQNLFVAGFVGSPPMNLAEATIEEAEGRFFIRFDGHRLRVGGTSIEADDSLRRYAWRQVVVGIRPEDLAEVAPTVDADERLTAVVARREDVGPNVLLTFKVAAPLLLAEDPRRHDDLPPIDALAENLWSAQLAGSTVRAGGTVHLAVRPDRLHLFDPRTGGVIPH